MCLKKIVVMWCALWGHAHASDQVDPVFRTLAIEMLGNVDDLVKQYVGQDCDESDNRMYDPTALKTRFLQNFKVASIAKRLTEIFSADEAAQAVQMMRTPFYKKVALFREGFGADIIWEETSKAMEAARNGCPIDSMATTQLRNAPVSSLKEEEFNSLVSQKKTFVLELTLKGCGPCKQLKPLYSRLAGEYKDRVPFFVIADEEARALSESLEIQGFPTIVFFKEGQEIGRSVGFGIEETKEKELLPLLEAL